MYKKRQQHLEFLRQYCKDKHKRDFKWDYRYIRIGRAIIIIFNFILLYLILKNGGIQVLGIFLAIFIFFHLVKEVVHYLYLWRFEKRILRPVEELQKAVEQVAEGKYNVTVEYDTKNKIGFLIESFNKMARRLEESEKFREEYEENRKDLITNISHDLKTPISSIQGYVEAICQGVVKSPEKVNQYLEIISANTKYVNKLIDDLFLFSKLDIEKVEFKFELINIQVFLRDLIQEMSLELEEKNIKVNYKDEVYSEAYCTLDGKRINQALRNIIGNSVKYGPDKDLVIDIALKHEDGSIYLEIRDNGPGIPEEKLSHIFERFYRIEPERTKDVMSTGLGLAIAREIIEAHGGLIEAENVAPQGVCFKLCFRQKNGNREGTSFEKSSDN